MDTRTVISGMPYDLIDKRLIKTEWLNSIFSNDINDELNKVFHCIGNCAMFSNEKTILKPLYELRDWKINDDGIFCNNNFNFDVRYYDIEINGREIQHWSQPLFCSKGSALFGLIIKKVNDEYKILISIRKFIGSSSYELAPTVYIEYSESNNDKNNIEKLFYKYLNNNNSVIRDVVLSEEGGRFYHEQNRNAIIEINECVKLPKGYLFVSLGTLKRLIRMTQLVNIQLRNLISIIDIFKECEK